MSYQTIALAAMNEALRRRVAAAAAVENVVPGEAPIAAADRIMWACAAEPGWGEAWESALAHQATLPDRDRSEIGDDPTVITDGMILSAAQKHLPRPEEPEPLPEVVPGTP